MSLGTEDIFKESMHSLEVTVTVTGTFLIENGIAEEWLKRRKPLIDKCPSLYKDMFTNGRINESFKDSLSVGQAQAIGLIDCPDNSVFKFNGK